MHIDVCTDVRGMYVCLSPGSQLRAASCILSQLYIHKEAKGRKKGIVSKVRYPLIDKGKETASGEK